MNGYIRKFKSDAAVPGVDIKNELSVRVTGSSIVCFTNDDTESNILLNFM